MTREQRRQKFANECDRLIQRIAKAGEGHKATRDLQARLVDARRQQIRTELALERKGRAA